MYSDFNSDSDTDVDPDIITCMDLFHELDKCYIDNIPITEKVEILNTILSMIKVYNININNDYLFNKVETFFIKCDIENEFDNNDITDATDDIMKIIIFVINNT
jgi:hypothetical protein